MAKVFRLRIQKFCLVFLILFSVVGCDQGTKQLARTVIPQTGSLSFFGDHLILTHTQNIGAFLSLGANWPELLRTMVFSVATLVFLLILGAMLIRSSWGFYKTLGVSLLLAGGIGNMIDRLMFGSVTDFIFLQMGLLHTGVFNIADVAIVIGGLILGVRILDSEVASNI